jgi:hypothetical protein
MLFWNATATDNKRSTLEWQYSLTYLFCAMFIPVAVLWIDWDFSSSQIAFSSLTMLAAWLRYMSSVRRDYTICLASSISLGLATAIKQSSLTAVGARCFPINLQNTATAIAVQINHCGFGLATLAIPFGIFATVLGDVETEFHNFLLSQAVFCSLIWCFQLWIYVVVQARSRKPPARKAVELIEGDTDTEQDTEHSILNPAYEVATLLPATPQRNWRGGVDAEEGKGEEGEEGEGEKGGEGEGKQEEGKEGGQAEEWGKDDKDDKEGGGGGEVEEEEDFAPRENVGVKCENLYHFLSWSLLQDMLPLSIWISIGTYFIGITDNSFMALGYDTKQAAWANFSLVMGGTVAGLAFGEVPFAHYYNLVKGCMVVSSMLAAIIVGVATWMPRDPKFAPKGNIPTYSALMVLIPLLGATTLGAAGMVLEILRYRSRPYSPAYTCGFVSMILAGAVFGLAVIDHTDYICMCVTCVAMCAVYASCSTDPLGDPLADPLVATGQIAHSPGDHVGVVGRVEAGRAQ